VNSLGNCVAASNVAYRALGIVTVLLWLLVVVGDASVGGTDLFDAFDNGVANDCCIPVVGVDTY
jgi:hypothetical protein